MSKNIDKKFSNKTLLITGGTGSFGTTLLNRLINTDVREIRILSRDEKKQEDMRKHYNNPKINFYIGDVRDYQSVLSCMHGVDYLFHAAALKQVPSCEFHPLEAIKTNVLGTENVLQAAMVSGIKRVVCLSTDKAVYPINAMGISKAMMEKIAVAKSRTSKSCVICVTRYGNVMASRGSVIPLFAQKILAGKPLTVTDPSMTRFMMSLDDAVHLVFYAFEKGKTGDIFIQKAPSATLEVLTTALVKILSKKPPEIKIIGTRHGEKQHETLLSREEMAIAQDMGNYFRIPADVRDLNYERFFDKGETKISQHNDYNSHNTRRLNVQQTIKMLEDLKYIQTLKRGESPLEN